MIGIHDSEGSKWLPRPVLLRKRICRAFSDNKCPLFTWKGTVSPFFTVFFIAGQFLRGGDNESITLKESPRPNTFTQNINISLHSCSQRPASHWRWPWQLRQQPRYFLQTPTHQSLQFRLLLSTRLVPCSYTVVATLCDCCDTVAMGWVKKPWTNRSVWKRKEVRTGLTSTVKSIKNHQT